MPFLRLLRPSRRSPRTWLSVLLLFLALETLLHYYLWTVPQPAAELDPPFHAGCREPAVDEPRERAALVMLARNREVEQAAHTVALAERHFNRWFHYPVVFLNDEPWEAGFVDRMKAIVSGEARFEVLPNGTWGFPADADVDAAMRSMDRQEKAGIAYGGNVNYHHMCRFFSGDFFLLDALREFRYYWRLEPNVHFFCDLTYDPFAEMARHGKVYGWTLALWELLDTVPSLFRVVSDYKEAEGIAPSPFWKTMVTAEWTPWPFRWLHASRDGRDRHGDKWNRCHFWSNFEIADLDFFRGDRYQKLYRHLLSRGGFYTERWGDAAVHSLALALLLDPAQMHYFEDIGYQHDNLWTCPANAPGRQLPDSGALRRGDAWDEERAGGVGCRCSCPYGGRARRNIQDYCIVKMNKPNTRARSPWFGP